MNRYVKPNSSCSSIIKFTTWAWIETSSAETASSAIINLGSNARALALEPKLIIADEAVSALDVSIQAQVVNLMMELQEEFGLTYLFISHDMAVIERVSHRIGVMYLGEIVEIGLRSQIFENPQHPYTKKLMAAVPIADPTKRKKKLNLMNDEIPSLLKPIGFEPEDIQMIKLGEDHYVKPFDRMKAQN